MFADVIVRRKRSYELKYVCGPQATHCGLVEFISMPFVLKTTGATFQELMQATFSDFLMGNVIGSSDNQTDFCVLYIEDLIIRSMSDYGALEHYEQIFQRASQVGMQFKPSKCTFFSTHHEVLGHIFTPNGSIPDSKKVQAISDFLIVNSQTAVQKFLGMVGFTGTTSQALHKELTTYVNFYKRITSSS